jgi:stage V sporulation protein AC
MNMTKETYKKYADARAPRSPLLRDCTRAFLVGGLICSIGQALTDTYTKLCGMEKQDAGTLTAATLVLAAAILTGLGVFDRIAKFAGAGTLVPITGFANSVVSPAIDFKSEGFITGMSAKMFQIAGPVIVFGTLASVIYGVVLMLFQ